MNLTHWESSQKTGASLVEVLVYTVIFGILSYFMVGGLLDFNKGAKRLENYAHQKSVENEWVDQIANYVSSLNLIYYLPEQSIVDNGSGPMEMAARDSSETWVSPFGQDGLYDRPNLKKMTMASFDGFLDSHAFPLKRNKIIGEDLDVQYDSLIISRCIDHRLPKNQTRINDILALDHAPIYKYDNVYCCPLSGLQGATLRDTFLEARCEKMPSDLTPITFVYKGEGKVIRYPEKSDDHSILGIGFDLTFDEDSPSEFFLNSFVVFNKCKYSESFAQQCPNQNDPDYLAKMQYDFIEVHDHRFSGDIMSSMSGSGAIRFGSREVFE